MPWYGFALITAVAISIIGLLQKRTLQREHSIEFVTLLMMAKLIMFLLVFAPSLKLGVNSWYFF